MKFSISTESIQQHVMLIKKQELQSRERITDGLESMLASVDQILGNEKTDPVMMQIVTGVKDGILKNMEHIRSGRSLLELPIAVELIEMGKEAVIPKKSPEPNSHPGPEYIEVRRGFFERVQEWVMSPWSHGWKDVHRVKRVLKP